MGSRIITDKYGTQSLSQEREVDCESDEHMTGFTCWKIFI